MYAVVGRLFDREFSEIPVLLGTLVYLGVLRGASELFERWWIRRRAIRRIKDKARSRHKGVQT